MSSFIFFIRTRRNTYSYAKKKHTHTHRETNLCLYFYEILYYRNAESCIRDNFNYFLLIEHIVCTLLIYFIC